jgi:hypothetical protein
MLDFRVPNLPQTRRIDMNTGMPVEATPRLPEPQRVGPGITLGEAMADAERHAAKPEADNPLLAEAAAWARGRSQTRAIIEIYAEVLALRELVRQLQEND